ncbi:chloramphenicol-sensitive protein RarD [Maridesulfovibrio ferrireducens]|uniref:Chloramphenicol-sensitive protein RarD n=1 Tax=Maridesulfovibrio ferrireducens TaxID=246191 RepID=A0A1G9J518_9BACT|nr:EamA family transporter RarD [Maridesulfovibrio ferrireducens]SDL32385.1 chloramphenicol-sensitive protein RarD [Maridesulfovibrio ferrireducens]
MINRSREGLIFAVAAFIMWGLLPIYWKTLKEVPPLEVLCHRVVWSFFFLAVVLSLKKRWVEVITALQDKKVKILLAASSSLIGVNWFVFIWSITNDHVVEASLGYYINPLVNILLGFIFMNEKLNRLQGAAICCAFAGVLYSVIDLGKFPYIALTLAVSFALYGLVRKVMKVESLPGLFVETAVLTPLAGGYLLWLATEGTLCLGQIGGETDALLIGTGVVTSIPLLCFANGARRLKLMTLGMLQYIAPTLMLLLGIFIYNEPFDNARLVTFCFIWTGIAIYLFDSIHRQMKRPKGIA